jgi:hypothetical protein
LQCKIKFWNGLRIKGQCELGMYNGKFKNNVTTTKEIPMPTSCISYQNKTITISIPNPSIHSVVHQIIQSSQLRIIMSNLQTSVVNDLQSFLIISIPSALMLRLWVEKESINVKVEDQFDECKISSIHNLQGKVLNFFKLLLGS